MSGRLEAVPFEKCTTSASSIFQVTITGVDTGTITEIETVSTTAGQKTVYKAEINEVLYNHPDAHRTREGWHVRLKPAEQTALKNIKNKGYKGAAAKDTIYIMHQQDISYTIIYEVEGRHRIFFYYYCPDAAETIETGKTYYFVSNTLFSEENGIYYGNQGFGLYPHTPEMLKKINALVKKKND